jgi:hypothetical protein
MRPNATWIRYLRRADTLKGRKLRVPLALGVVFAVACAEDTARAPVLTSADVGPRSSGIETIRPEELETVVAQIHRSAESERAAERRRWVELELMHPNDRATLASLWERYRKADLLLTDLEEKRARSPARERVVLDGRVGSSDRARLRVQLWIRRGLASSAEWLETESELDAAVAAFETSVREAS